MSSHHALTVLLVLLLLFMMGCSDRERLNPFDPQNPNTGGAPTHFSAHSNRDTIFLSWKAMDVDDLSHYLLYRSENGAAFEDFRIIDPDVNSYSDVEIDYDVNYRYAVQAHTESEQGMLSDTLQVTPGAFNFWITDYYDFSIKRMSYDGSHFLGHLDIPTPIAIEAGLGNQAFYVADYWSSAIHEVNRQMQIVRTFELPDQPVDISLDLSTSTLYVLTLGMNQILQLRLVDGAITSIDLDINISFQGNLAFDVLRRDVWVMDAFLDTVVQVDLSDNQPVLRYVGSLPLAENIYADPITGGVWLPSHDGVIRLTPNAQADTLLTGYSIADLSLNSYTGDCYYVGYRHSDLVWETGRIERGSLEVHQILGEEYNYLNHIQVIPGLDPQGFLVMQLGTWRIMRFDGQGSLIGERDGFNGRLDIALE